MESERSLSCYKSPPLVLSWGRRTQSTLFHTVHLTPHPFREDAPWHHPVIVYQHLKSGRESQRGSMARRTEWLTDWLTDCQLQSNWLRFRLRHCSSTPRSSKWSLPFKFSDQNCVCISDFSHACYIPRPSHIPLFDHPNNIWWRVPVLKLLNISNPFSLSQFQMRDIWP
jgi:hypothetical protein